MTTTSASTSPGPMPRRDWAVALALAALTVLTRWPYRARLLPTWDAIQFALALDDYDIVRHQPHPPGYVLFVALARGLAPVAGDPATSLTVLAVGASALAVLLVYRLGWSLYGRGPALVAGLGLLTSPLFWANGVVGLSYAAEAALGTGVALAAWAMRGGRPGALVGSAVLLGSAAGVRQSMLLVLAPAWLGMAWIGFRRRGPVLAGLVLVAASVASWAVPMLWVTGPARYLAASLELYQSTVHATTLAGGGWWRNVVGLGEALLVGLGLFAPVLLWGCGRRLARGGRGGVRTTFFALWVLPAFALYALVHLGQHGYLLTVLPACYLVVGRAASELLTRSGRAGVGWPGVRPVVAGAALAGVLAVHGGFFLAAPPVDVPFPPPGASWPARVEAELRAMYRFRLWTGNTAGGLREREAIIRTYVDAVRREFDPRDTVLLTELGNPRSYPWFRHVMYYLPEFSVYHLRLGTWRPGYLLSRELGSMAAIDERTVPLPLTARRLVWVVDHWDPAVPRPAGLEARALPRGRWLYVAPVGRPSMEHAGYRLAPVTAFARLR